MYVRTVLLALQFILYFSFLIGVFSSPEIPSLPFCPHTEGTGFVLVSTLDGKLSAVDTTGNLTWEIDTGPGPLLLSNIHNLELTNNGEWVRIIPSLTGTLYKFDGSTIDPISITADTLLKSSFKYSDDLVVAGAIEVRTYGVGFRSGEVFYECTPKSCLSKDQQNTDDVLLIERSTQTVRAVEPRSGIERWNFSVGLHSIKLPHVSCIDSTTKLFDWNLTTILPEGILKASTTKNNVEIAWQYQFSAPIVRVWRWNGVKLTEINLFSPKNIPNVVLTTPFLPSIYVGMHKKQLYIHESVTMQNVLHGLSHTGLVVAESTSVAKIPWKPIPASTQITEDDATALSVLNGSEYVNGNGYYLYTETDISKKNSQLCENNQTDSIPMEEEIMDDINDLYYMNIFFFKYTKEFALVLFTIVLCNILFRFWHNVSNEKAQNNKEIIIIEKPVEAHVTRTMERTPSENSDSFTSRYLEDFDTIRCLGKGGFGVVFEVKQKIDECFYAIKRITLPKEHKSRQRVMREVKALAKLDHQNIVRYFCSWVERPPLGWKEEHDKQWIEDKSEIKTMTTTTTTHSKLKRSKSASVSIDIPLHRFQETLDFSGDNQVLNDDDSFIVFEKHTGENSNSTKTEHNSRSKSDTHIVFQNSKSQKSCSASTVQEDTMKSCSTISSGIEISQNTFSEHLSKKIDWRRPGRKHHSWDISQGVLVPKQQEIEPPVYLYIQMQLCQKESLKEWLNNNKNREYNFVLGIFSQILDAVEYVHLRGLIHRDLKPSNIFFSLEGQIKVGDFGLVKDMEDSLDLELSRGSFGYSNKTGHTKEVGTQLYMSPEQFHSRLYNYKVDIYSLGLIFFELLVPFSTDMERIKTLTDVKKHIYPENFQKQFTNEYNLLQNMLCENPEKRLTTVGIRAKPPFNKIDPLYGEDCHYSLKNLQKS